MADMKINGSVQPAQPAGTSPINNAAPAKDNELDKPYFDERKITIALVKNYSLFRKSNDKFLPRKNDYIGSSLYSSRTLSSNKAEIEAYFPAIVGLASNNPDFMTRVKQYLNNFKIKVDELGKSFNVGFHYNTKKDYLYFKTKEDEINQEYDEVSAKNLEVKEQALKNKIIRLNALESEKHAFGYPDNIEEYIAFRHCLLYNDIAKDIIFINSNPSIRFYFKDDQKEAEKLAKYRLQVNKAKKNYVECIADAELFNNIYIQYCVVSGLPILSSLNKSQLDKEVELDKFSTNEPIKFNKIFSNKDVAVASKIELLIAKGELRRYNDNQNIVLEDGGLVGANMTEAVNWFKSPENSAVVNSLYNRLKNN